MSSTPTASSSNMLQFESKKTQDRTVVYYLNNGYRPAVARHALSNLRRVRVLDVRVLHHEVVAPLARLEPCALLRGERVPLRRSRAHGRHSACLRQAVDVVQNEAEPLHLHQDVGRRRRAAGDDAHSPRQRLLVRGGRADDHAEHRGRAAHVRHLPPRGAVEDVLGRGAVEAHVGAARRSWGRRAARRPHREQRGAASHNSVECGAASRVGPRHCVEEVREPLQGGLQAHQCAASQEPIGRTHAGVDRENAHLSRPEPGGGAQRRS
jgi:hypothetical protein